MLFRYVRGPGYPLRVPPQHRLTRINAPHFLSLKSELLCLGVDVALQSHMSERTNVRKCLIGVLDQVIRRNSSANHPDSYRSRAVLSLYKRTGSQGPAAQTPRDF
jgi:hypothetical protein